MRRVGILKQRKIFGISTITVTMDWNLNFAIVADG